MLLNSEKRFAKLLRGLARVPFLLLFLYRALRTDLIPGQLFHDMQATIRAKFAKRSFTVRAKSCTCGWRGLTGYNTCLLLFAI